MTSANIMDPSKISITVLVEDDDAMARGTYWDCQSSSYPCKYFFAKFRKFQV